MSWFIAGYLLAGIILALLLKSNGAYERFAKKARKELERRGYELEDAEREKDTLNSVITGLTIITVFFWWIVLARITFIDGD